MPLRAVHTFWWLWIGGCFREPTAHPAREFHRKLHALPPDADILHHGPPPASTERGWLSSLLVGWLVGWRAGEARGRQVEPPRPAWERGGGRGLAGLAEAT